MIPLIVERFMTSLDSHLAFCAPLPSFLRPMLRCAASVPEIHALGSFPLLSFGYIYIGERMSMANGECMVSTASTWHEPTKMPLSTRRGKPFFWWMVGALVSSFITIYICVCVMSFLLQEYGQWLISHEFVHDKIFVTAVRGNLPYGVFLKWGYPQTIHFNRAFHYKTSSYWGNPQFRKHQHVFWKKTPDFGRSVCSPSAALDTSDWPYFQGVMPWLG